MSDKVQRLREIVDAITKGNRDELTMRVPAEPDRDADLVISWAADEIERLRTECNNLEAEARAATGDNEWLRTVLIEVREDAVHFGMPTTRIDAALGATADQPHSDCSICHGTGRLADTTCPACNTPDQPKDAVK